MEAVLVVACCAAPAAIFLWWQVVSLRRQNDLQDDGRWTRVLGDPVRSTGGYLYIKKVSILGGHPEAPQAREGVVLVAGEDRFCLVDTDAKELSAFLVVGFAEVSDVQFATGKGERQALFDSATAEGALTNIVTTHGSGSSIVSIRIRKGSVDLSTRGTDLTSLRRTFGVFIAQVQKHRPD